MLEGGLTKDGIMIRMRTMQVMKKLENDGQDMGKKDLGMQNDAQGMQKYKLRDAR